MNTIAPATAEAVATTAAPAAPAAASAKWTVSQVEALYQLPLMDLLYRAQQVHRENFDPNEVQRSSLISIKTGGCPEDCNYCSQSARYKATEREALMQVEDVLAAAREAKAKGASRFCMGAAWRGPKEKELEVVTRKTPAGSRLRSAARCWTSSAISSNCRHDGMAASPASVRLTFRVVRCSRRASNHSSAAARYRLTIAADISR